MFKALTKNRCVHVEMCLIFSVNFSLVIVLHVFTLMFS